MVDFRFAQRLRVLLLAAWCAAGGCGVFPDTIPVKTGPEGMVMLERLPSRGATVRYSGPLKSFRASHPVSFSVHVVEQALRGLHAGIAPADRDGQRRGIKPTPLFSANESAFLASGITAALERAEPDQRVRFHVGPESDRTAGTLYVENGVIRLAFNHIHAPARHRDEHLSIYILSFTPEQAQEDPARPHQWIEIEADQPRVAVNYATLEALLPPEASAPSSTSARTQPAGVERTMKEVVDHQAKELESLKAELEALKKQLQTQPRSTDSKP